MSLVICTEHIRVPKGMFQNILPLMVLFIIHMKLRLLTLSSFEVQFQSVVSELSGQN